MPRCEVAILLLSVTYCLCYNWTLINLPKSHLPFLFRNNPDIKSDCDADPNCPYKDGLQEDRCWGYEEPCPTDKRMTSPRCVDSNDLNKHWSQEQRTEKFWRQGDFGYVKGKIDELETFCRGETQNDSSLVCTKHAGYCYAQNFVIDMRNGTLDRLRRNSMRYTPDIFLKGEIGGHCKLDKEKLEQEAGDKMLLSTWYGEIERFTELPYQTVDDKACDVTFDKPVIFMKLDATVNMYHHFCDFLNLYISQHINNSMSLDVQIVFWLCHGPRYGGIFREAFEAFTEHPIHFLYDYNLKRICVKEAMFPILARARHGLFYSTSLTPYCYGSSLFKAFSEHMAHRLQLTSEKPRRNKIRVTMLDRAANSRNILNQVELYETLAGIKDYDVKLVSFKFGEMAFPKQLKISHNSDIFIGMHGAGLTHMLFQPDWGAVIEIHNCGDIACYRDLARLRGLKYITWKKEDKAFAHSEDPDIPPKSKNYTFDNEEFVRLVALAADHVRSHPLFVAAGVNKDRDEL